MSTKLANRRPLGLPVATALAASIAVNANAFQYENGNFQLSFDSDVSIGSAWRMEDANPANIGPAKAGSPEVSIAAAAQGGLDGLWHKHGTSTQDNSNLLFKKNETYSKVIKATHELEINYLNYGAFVRGRYFYDFELMDEPREQVLYPASDPEPTKAALDKAGAKAEFLDVFTWANWKFGDRHLTARLGRQVISWGEGIFFPNGINSINPVSVSALRAPGVELKEAFIPVDALYGSLTATSNLTLEGFAQFNWKETEIDPCGTFFATSDLAGPGCTDGVYLLRTESGTPNSAINRAPRVADIEPDDSGQFGLAARYFAESIQTEFAAYYINYHSRLPILSGYYPVEDTTNDPVSDVSKNILNGIFPLAAYAVEYPEDIQLFGVSFNTSIDFGIPGGASAVSGEISMRHDQPFQIEDSVLLTGVAGIQSQICRDAPTQFNCFSDPSTKQGDFLSGAIRDSFYQAEVSLIHFFDRALGADRWTLVLNAAFDYANIPEKEELLLNSAYNADLFPIWATPQIETFATVFSVPPEARERNFYPTKFSWGYKARFVGTYSNVFSGVNLSPSITFGHDVNGVTPQPVSNFLEGSKSASLGLMATYQNTYSVDFAFTDFFGSEPYNQLNDRDFMTLSASASF